MLPRNCSIHQHTASISILNVSADVSVDSLSIQTNTVIIICTVHLNMHTRFTLLVALKWYSVRVSLSSAWLRIWMAQIRIPAKMLGILKEIPCCFMPSRHVLRCCLNYATTTSFNIF
jgi:hypothetical protein